MLQKKTTTIEQGLKQFKLHARDKYEEYAKEELDLMKEMEMYEEKFKAWEKEKEDKIVKKEIKSLIRTEAIKDIDVSDEEDAEEETGSIGVKRKLEKIDHEIEIMGGVYLGWSRTDHDDYLKLRTKHKGKVKTIAFMNEIKKLIPDISPEDVTIHSQNYENYLKLFNEKKEFLQRYKELKKIESRKENECIVIEKENEPKKSQISSKDELKKQKEKVVEWKKKKEEIGRAHV